MIGGCRPVFRCLERIIAVTNDVKERAKLALGPALFPPVLGAVNLPGILTFEMAYAIIILKTTYAG